MTDYNELKNSPKVESIRFVGAGIALVTLKSNYGNHTFGGYNDENQDLAAPTFAMAKQFVDGAIESSLVRNARFGGLTREAKGTPFSCSVSSESYWCS